MRKVKAIRPNNLFEAVMQLEKVKEEEKILKKNLKDKEWMNKKVKEVFGDKEYYIGGSKQAQNDFIENFVKSLSTPKFKR